VLPWGFGAFGRTYGKADAIKEGFSDPVDIRPVLLLNNPEPEADKVTYHPHESRDHAIHDVFNRHGVKVEDPDQR
jgi:diketogulonate reductase-like aldo/keto reductase